MAPLLVGQMKFRYLLFSICEKFTRDAIMKGNIYEKITFQQKKSFRDFFIIEKKFAKSQNSIEKMKKT